MTISKRERHLMTLRSMPCILCGEPGPNEVHHVRQGQGLAQRASDYLAIPLCPDCHRGPKGRHGDQTLMKIYKLTEMDLLAKTLETLFEARHGYGP